MTRPVDRAWLWKDNPEVPVSVGIDFKWVVEWPSSIWCNGCLLGWGDTKEDETVDRVGGRIWATKSDLLNRKKVCGVIKGWTLNDMWNLKFQLATRSIEVRRFQGMGARNALPSAFLTLMIIIVSKIENGGERQLTLLHLAARRCLPPNHLKPAVPATTTINHPISSVNSRTSSDVPGSYNWY